ncbi:MAG: Arc family DNA-binding protein [Pseudomonas fluorescens]
MNTVRTQVRIPAEIIDWLKEQAKADHRSMNGQLVETLVQAKRQAALKAGNEEAPGAGTPEALGNEIH